MVFFYARSRRLSKRAVVVAVVVDAVWL